MDIYTKISRSLFFAYLTNITSALHKVLIEFSHTIERIMLQKKIVHNTKHRHLNILYFEIFFDFGAGHV
jgi:hypothetical protein